jgi:heptosyltransferase-1
MNSSPFQHAPVIERNPVRSILVVRLGAMGDLIHAIAAVSALRAARPDCKIGWVVEKRWSELLCAPGFAPRGERTQQRPLVDDLFTLDIRALRSHPISPAIWKEMRACFVELRSAGYEQVVDIQGSLRSALIASLSGATESWGESHPREAPAAILYRHRVSVSGSHVAQQNLALISAVAGIPLDDCAPLLPRDAGSAKWCEQLLTGRSTPTLATAARIGDPSASGFCILNPGAGWGAKCWPPSSFAEVARRLAEVGIRSLVNFGPGEKPLAEQVADASGGAAEAISCTVSQLVELTGRAGLFIGGDTGPMHLAAALGVPVVGLFGPTNPERNGPWGTRSMVLRSRQSATSYHHTERPDEALQSISPAEVAAAALTLLQQQTSAAVQETS